MTRRIPRHEHCRGNAPNAPPIRFPSAMTAQPRSTYGSSVVSPADLRSLVRLHGFDFVACASRLNAAPATPSRVTPDRVRLAFAAGEGLDLRFPSAAVGTGTGRSRGAGPRSEPVRAGGGRDEIPSLPVPEPRVCGVGCGGEIDRMERSHGARCEAAFFRALDAIRGSRPSGGGGGPDPAEDGSSRAVDNLVGKSTTANGQADVPATGSRGNSMRRGCGKAVKGKSGGAGPREFVRARILPPLPPKAFSCPIVLVADEIGAEIDAVLDELEATVDDDILEREMEGDIVSWVSEHLERHPDSSCDSPGIPTSPIRVY